MVLLQAAQCGAVAVPIIFAQPAGGFGRARLLRQIGGHVLVDQPENAGIGMVQRVVEVEKPNGVGKSSSAPNRECSKKQTGNDAHARFWMGIIFFEWV